MHKFYTTKYLFGFGPALVVVAAEELEEGQKLRCEAFVGFPKTSHPPEVSYDRRSFCMPQPEVAEDLEEGAETVEATEPSLPVTIDLAAMFEEGRFLARMLLNHYQELACDQSGDSSWLDELTFNEIDETKVRELWIRGHHRKVFKVLGAKARTTSLHEIVGDLKNLPQMERGE